MIHKVLFSIVINVLKLQLKMVNLELEMLISIFMLQLIMNRMIILLLGQLLVLEKEAVSEPQLDKSISILNMSNQLKT